MLNKDCVTEEGWGAGRKTFGYEGQWEEFAGHVVVGGSTENLPPGVRQEIQSHHQDV